MKKTIRNVFMSIDGERKKFAIFFQPRQIQMDKSIYVRRRTNDIQKCKTDDDIRSLLHDLVYDNFHAVYVDKQMLYSRTQVLLFLNSSLYKKFEERTVERGTPELKRLLEATYR